MSYQPSEEILNKYADVLINFALNGGEGVRKGETVHIIIPEAAKPFYVPLRNTVIKAGAHPIMQYQPADVRLGDVFALSSDEQLSYFPKKYFKGLVDEIDHSVHVIAEWDKYELQNIDPKKIFKRSVSHRQLQEWRHAKEAAGKFTWTIALYGTPAMAHDVHMSEEEYWDQIIHACFLESPSPIKVWKQVTAEIERIKEYLNSLDIEKLHVEAEDIDLWVGVGKQRLWLGGGGRNIPSFELFISPDWRQTEGTISFNQPLYRYGNVVEGISLRFAKGKVVEATATQNEHIIKEMISVKNADKIGEFSLTDGRFSRITRVMGETLFDENIGGPQGNTHIALGNAYQDSYPGDPSTITKKEWTAMGYNQSAVHTDIVSTTRRQVTAYLADGGTKVIYKDGQFQI